MNLYIIEIIKIKFLNQKKWKAVFSILIILLSVFEISLAQNIPAKIIIAKQALKIIPPIVVIAGKPKVNLIKKQPIPFYIQNNASQKPNKFTTGGYGGILNITNYNTEQGLALSSTVCSYQDRFGNLWFGTDGGGVSKYDGKSFTTFTVENGLANNRIFSIIEDNAGNFWFGTGGGGVSRFDGIRFTNFTTEQGLAHNTIDNICKDKKGNLWISTYGVGVSCYDGKKFTNYTEADGLAGNLVLNAYEDKLGNMWFTTFGGGVSKFDGKSFVNYTTKDGLASNFVHSMLQDEKGDLWFTTRGRGISRMKLDIKNGSSTPTFTNYNMEDGLADTSVYCCLQDKKGNLWFGTPNNGVSCYNGQTFVNYSTAQGLASNRVWSILEDNSGNIWFCTYGGGISRFDGNSFTTFTKSQGFTKDVIASINEDKKGNIWFGSYGSGVSRFDGNSVATFAPEHGLAGDLVFCSLQDKKGKIWFGTRSGGVSCFDGKSFSNYSIKQGLANKTVRSIYEDKSGKIWFGTQGGGVSCYDGRTFTNYSKQQGLSHDIVYGIWEDRKGQYWFATYGGGVSRFDPKAESKNGSNPFTNFSMAQGLANNYVHCILEDNQGNMWFGTAGGGVSRFDGKKFTNYTTADGLSDNFVTQLLQNAEGQIFMGTNWGISILVGWKEKAPIFENFSQRTGYPIRDVNVGQHAMFMDSKGIIWAGTGDAKTSLVRFDYKSVYKSTKPSSLLIQSIKINEEAVCWYNLMAQQSTNKRIKQGSKIDSSELAQQEILTFGKILSPEVRDSIRKKYSKIHFDSIVAFYPIPINLILPYNHNHITFDFLAIEPSRSYMVNYQYILEGYDTKWSPITKRTNAVFGNIHEGSYTFKVRAQSPDGIWSTPISYTFTVLAPWYRSFFAYLIYILSFIGLLVLGVKLNTYRLKREKIILEGIVKERTDEISAQNEEISSQNEEIQNQVEALNLEVEARKNSEKQLRRLTVAVEQSPVSIVITDTSGIIEYVNPKFCEITGYSESEVVGYNSRILKGNTAIETYQELWKTILAGNVWAGEFINLKKNGELYYAEAIIAPIKNEKNEIVNFVGVKTDITERKKAEEIQKANELELNELNTTKNKLFSIIAHDLRSPFNAILGFVDLLKQTIHINTLDQSVEMLDFINSSAQNTLKLVDTLLQWAKTQTNQINVELKYFQISVSIDLVLTELKGAALNKNITLIYSESEDLVVHADLNMLNTVLRNLISNAIKYTNMEGTITISAESKPHFIEFSVTDNGVGMTDEVKNNIFTSNLNESSQGTAYEKGTGLGLIICREFVTKQGGEIWAESELNKGSTFKFTLPKGKES